MKTIALVVIATACSPHRPERLTFVRQARIEGYDLLVEKCQVFTEDDEIKVEGCVKASQPLPVLVEPQQDVPSAQVQLSKEITVAIRDGLERCLDVHQVVGPLRLGLTIGPSGSVTAVAPDSGDADVTACAKGVFEGARFTPSDHGSTLTLTLRGAKP